MDIQIANRQRRHTISLKKVRQAARILLDALKRPDAELSILLVDDREIAGMNLAYLNRHGPTNVIAFPMREGAYGDLTPNLLGDVVICVDTAHRESRLAGRTLDERLTELLVHGVLHLCGYDHENGGSPARRMTAKSRRLVKQIEASWKLEVGNSKPKQRKAPPATQESRKSRSTRS
jgi:probable rRNA maturation factor